MEKHSVFLNLLFPSSFSVPPISFPSPFSLEPHHPSNDGNVGHFPIGSLQIIVFYFLYHQPLSRKITKKISKRKQKIVFLFYFFPFCFSHGKNFLFLFHSPHIFARLSLFVSGFGLNVISVFRLWAEVFHVAASGAGQVKWQQVSEDLVPVNITCIQDSPECVFHITAYNSQVDKILDVRLVQPGKEISLNPHAS